MSVDRELSACRGQGLSMSSALLLAVGLSGCGEGSSESALSGQWRADLEIGDGETAELIVDLGTVGSRWAGEFDLLKYGVENYPVEMASSGDTVRLHLTAMRMDFEGTLSSDGKSLLGTGRFEEEEIAVELRRVAPDPRFSEGFLELEAAADDPSLVETLSPDGTELRARFNADISKTRLLLLLSPS